MMKSFLIFASALVCSQPALASADAVRLTDAQLAQVRGTGGPVSERMILATTVDVQRSADLYTFTHSTAGAIDNWLATGQIQLIAANILGPPPLPR